MKETNKEEESLETITVMQDIRYADMYVLAEFSVTKLSEIVKPWSKSKPLSQQAPKSNKSPPKKQKRRIWTLG